MTPQRSPWISSLISALLTLLFPGQINAQPFNPQPVVPAQDGTGTVVTPSNNQFDITGGQRSGDNTNLFHSFERLGLSQGQIINFLASPEIRNILGRVTGGEASFINGLVQITGGNSNLFLINPAGILFGEHASLNIPGSLTVNTATGVGFESVNGLQFWQENNWSNLVGTPNHFVFDSQDPGSIANFGNLSVAPGASLTLLGGSVLNAGNLQASSGQITVAALPEAGMIRIGQVDHLLNLEVLPAPTAELHHTEINPLSLPELLTGGQEQGATMAQVSEAGAIVLTHSQEALTDSSGTTIVTGEVDAGSRETNESGGEINLVGERVILADAAVDASGSNGGGTIRVGGDVRGEGSIPNASQTRIDATSQIHADAAVTGNGGQIIVWSEERTEIAGQLRAQGGSLAGNGGFIETSSRGVLSILQAPDLSALNGQGGTWLIDPEEIEIVEILDSVPPSGITQIEADVIEDALAGSGSIVIETDPAIPGAGNITFNTSIQLDAVEVTEANLTLNAVNDIRLIGQDIVNLVPDLASLNLEFNADFDGDGSGNVSIGNALIDTGNGNFTATGNSINFFQNSLVSTGAGTIDLTAVAVGIDNVNGITLIENSRLLSTDGEINLTGTSDGLGDNNDGISIQDSQIESTGSGTISLVGTGGNGINSEGILVFDNSLITANDGAVQLEGTGRGTDSSPGILINSGGRIETEGTGDITIDGISEAVGTNNDGLILFDQAQIEALGSGNINLIGESGDGANSQGITIGNDSFVESDSGNIALTGITNSTDQGDGIVLSNSRVESAEADIDLEGSITESNANNAAILLLGNAQILTDGLGEINLTETTAVGIESSGIQALGNSLILSNSGAIQVDGSRLFFGENTLIASDDAGAIDLTADQEVRTGLIDNFGGDITLTSDSDEILITEDFDTSGEGGTDGDLTFNGDVQLTQLSTTFTTADSGESGGEINFNGTVNGTSNTGNSLTLESGTSDIQFNQAVGNLIPLGDLTINSSGTTTFNGGVNSNSLSTNPGGLTQLAGDVTTAGEVGQRYGDAVNLLSDLTLTGDEIDFAAPVTGVTQNLNIAADSDQTITLDGTVNSNPNILELTQVDLSFLPSDLNTLTIGDQQQSNPVVLSGDVTFSVPTTLQAESINSAGFSINGVNNATLTLNAQNDIVTGNVVNSGRSVTLNSTDGNIDTRSGVIDTRSIDADGGDVILSAGNQIFAGEINTSTSAPENTAQSGTLSFNSSNPVTLSGDLNTSAPSGQANSIDFQAPVEIETSITLNTAGNSSSGAINFSNSLNATQAGVDLNLEAGSANINLASFGDTTPFNSITTRTAGTVVLNDDVTAAQILDFSFPSEVVLNTDVALTAQTSGAILFNSPITGAGNSLILNAETIDLDQVGSLGAELSAISFQGETLNLSGNLFTNDLDFANVTQVNVLDNITLDTSSNNSDLPLTANVDGPGSLTLNTGFGNVTLGTIGSIAPLQGLQIDAGNVTGVGSIATGTDGVNIAASGSTTLNNPVNSLGTVDINAPETLTTDGIAATEITLSTQGDLTTGNLTTSSEVAAGNIGLNAPTGGITTGDLTAVGTTGGDITVEAATTIQAGRIDASGQIGDGGNITLDPAGDVEVGSIRSEAGGAGVGGNVLVESTGQFVRVTDSFNTPFAPSGTASISTAGPNGGGAVTIRHAGGELDTPVAEFEVGNPTVNGTAAAITTGTATVSSGTTLSNSAIEGNIAVQTDDPPFTDLPDDLSDAGLTLEEGVTVERDSLSEDSDVADDKIDLTDNPEKAEELKVNPSELLSSSDFAFQSDDLDITLKLLENSRNREFEEYLGIDIPAVDRQSIQELLRQVEADTQEVYVIIYIVARDEQLEILAIPSSGDPIRRPVPEATAEKVFSTVQDFQINITSVRTRNTESYIASASQLYDWMLKPIESDLEELGATTLLFSLGAGFRSLPIAALWDGEQHLVEKYKYSLIPTASLVTTGYTSLKKADVLAMGASTFTNQNPLPAVPVELGTITELWPGESFLNEEFTLENLEVQRRLTEYDIVHLATHADFQAGLPRDSYIQLWDKQLSLDELPRLNWDQPPLELLVLSACRTAVGDPEAELGFAGLSVQAGVKSSLASLWYVSDQGTLALMTEFYGDLRTTSIKAAALRETQIAMIRGDVRIEAGQIQTNRGSVALPPELADQQSQSLEYPYYWAGFTLIGTPW
ncbi:MAG: CHAT domain-containing protein [Microcoleaceae cyanobacterium]